SFLSFFFSSRRRHTRFSRDWSSDVCSSDLPPGHFRWSALAELTPYLEQSVIYDKLDLEVPLFGGPAQSPPYSVFPQNRPWVALRSEERRVGKECRSRRSRARCADQKH